MNYVHYTLKCNILYIHIILKNINKFYKCFLEKCVQDKCIFLYDFLLSNLDYGSLTL